jgi:hypothetical protein
MALRVNSQSLLGAVSAVAFAVAMAAAPAPTFAQSNEPIKIGFSLALTGPLAPNGKQALLGAKIWENSDHARIAARASANAIVRAAILKAGAGAWLSALQPE